MGCRQRAQPTGPVEQAPGQDGLVELFLHQRLVPLDVVLLLLGGESELHADLLFRGGKKTVPAAPVRPGGQTANSASVLRPSSHRVSEQRAATGTLGSTWWLASQ